MDILIIATQFILALSILIVLHELGHFIPAKLFKTRVEKFYLFFDPYFSIFKKKIGGTEYGIGWLPLGGYVKISGMIDESMDTEQMKEAPKDWEFRSKPAWQRLIIMIGGVTVNIVLAVIIYIMILFTWGDTYLPVENAIHGIQCSSLAEEMGLRDGDKIISIDGQKVERFEKIANEIIIKRPEIVTVNRSGKFLEIPVPDDLIEKLIDGPKRRFLSVSIPFFAGGFVENSAAKKAGLEIGDQLVAINGEPKTLFSEYPKSLPKYANQTIDLTVIRNDEKKVLQVALGDTPSLGVQALSTKSLIQNKYFETKTTHYNFVESIPAGYNKMVETLSDYIDQLKLILQPSTGAYKGMGGFISIAQIFPTEWIWEVFWTQTAFLSVVLAFMNILPIPALDGGHVTFLLYEIISGRKPGDKFMEYAQYAGLIILVSLLLFANGNDLIRNVFN